MVLVAKCISCAQNACCCWKLWTWKLSYTARASHKFSRCVASCIHMQQVQLVLATGTCGTCNRYLWYLQQVHATGTCGTCNRYMRYLQQVHALLATGTCVTCNRYMYLSMDEAGTHVGGHSFRLIVGAYDQFGDSLLGTGCSAPIRQVPLPAYRIIFWSNDQFPGNNCNILPTVLLRT